MAALHAISALGVRHLTYQKSWAVAAGQHSRSPGASAVVPWKSAAQRFILRRFALALRIGLARGRGISALALTFKQAS